ncbi:hypothetical protein [Pseudonocardia zijingensis]|uniref:Uncharacterized protein n=1 Tax=Pseudonocardia zijingensis TaxID=153376 RepID=A0ABN1N8U2_9PSEU
MSTGEMKVKIWSEKVDDGRRWLWHYQVRMPGKAVRGIELSHPRALAAVGRVRERESALAHVLDEQRSAAVAVPTL